MAFRGRRPPIHGADSRTGASARALAADLVCVTGPDGAGKSTVIADVLRRLAPPAGRGARAVSAHDVFPPRGARGRAAPSPRALDLYLAALRPTSRALLLFHALHEALARAAGAGRVLLLDGYWYKYAAAEVAHGGDRDEIERLAAIFPEPRLLVHLHVDPLAAARRKQRFTAYETGFAAPATRAAFVAFQRRAVPVLRALVRARGAIELDGTRPIDELGEWIVREIRARRPRAPAAGGLRLAADHVG